MVNFADFRSINSLVTTPLFPAVAMWPHLSLHGMERGEFNLYINPRAVVSHIKEQLYILLTSHTRTIHTYAFVHVDWER